MKERSQIILLCAILLVIGAGFAYLTIYGSKFTFYKAELNINGNVIEEKLYYTPNKPYHTLYRDFETPILSEYNRRNPSNTQIQEVTCSQGTAYYKDYFGHQHIMAPYFDGLLTYTESNEYGCGFGNTLGFSKGEEYYIKAKYVLNPDTLIEYDGRHYIKFVAYSKSRHPLLHQDTLTIEGNAVYTKYVFPSSEFIIYILYEPVNIEDYNIIRESKLRTGNDILLLIYYIIMALGPAILCLVTWITFGRENKEGDYPEELSQYPKERKAWEVAAYFHPPFKYIGSTLLPAVIMDFYNRKILDIKETNKKTYIKILNETPQLDETESAVLDLLKDAQKQSHSIDGYFNLESVSDKAKEDLSKARKLNASYKKIKKTIENYSKDYVDKNGVVVVLYMLIPLMLNIYIEAGYMVLLYALSIGIIILVISKTALFTKFKKEYYLEYQQWQGFKNYLSNLDSIPRTPYQGIVMWEKYLIYATSLGVGKKVLDSLKRWKIIDEKHYKSYSDITRSSFNTSIRTGSSSSKGFGGFGGGGGGIGGGGGGGR